MSSINEPVTPAENETFSDSGSSSDAVEAHQNVEGTVDVEEEPAEVSEKQDSQDNTHNEDAADLSAPAQVPAEESPLSPSASEERRKKRDAKIRAIVLKGLKYEEDESGNIRVISGSMKNIVRWVISRAIAGKNLSHVLLILLCRVLSDWLFLLCPQTLARLRPLC
jgi:hypothetical protein